MADPAQGRTIRLFLVDGKPTGIMTAEIGNWSGKIVIGGRADLPEIVRRPEAGKTGVYFWLARIQPCRNGSKCTSEKAIPLVIG